MTDGLGLSGTGLAVGATPGDDSVVALQAWLILHGQAIEPDGKGGPATRAAILAAFTNKSAPAATPADIANAATALDCSPKQINAVAHVESAGGGFLNSGLPKILFERHYFWRLTQGKFGAQAYSNPQRGGYGEDSWEKLTLAACKDPHAAFQSASWGKFQVMGANWHDLGYTSPLDMAFSFTTGEAAHYDSLVRFVKANHLEAKVQALSTNPADCAPFAAAYNGSGFRANHYDSKLAEAMK